MFNFIIPEISQTAGVLNDGSLIGAISQSNPTAVLMGESLITISQVLRKDVTATGSTFTDVTTAATDATTGDFNPFGTNATMSLGDAFYFRTLNNVDTHVFYAQVSTQGVGTWTMALQEWNTTADQWETVTGLVDSSNGFKAGTGVYKISYTSGAEGSVRLDDASPKYIWHRVVLTSFTSVTTAPILSRIWCADTSISYRNLTTAWTTGVFTSVPSEMLPRINDCILFVCPGKTMGVDVTVTTAESANFTRTWKYLNSSGQSVALAGVSDPSNGLTTTGSHNIRFTVPTDWTTQSITDSNSAVQTGFILCLQITSITTEGPTAPTHSTAFTRSFGASTTMGVQTPTAITIKAVTVDEPMATTGTGAVTLALYNLTTGTSADIAIPASPTYPLNVDISDLSLAINDKFGLFYTSGSRAFTSVPVILHG